MGTAEAPAVSTESSEPSSEWPEGRIIVRPGRRLPPALLYLTPALTLYMVFVLGPLLDVVRLAFYRWNGYGSASFIGLDNFSSLWSDTVFRTSLLHSAQWIGAAAILPSLLGLGFALLLARSRWPSLLAAIIFFPAFLPATVLAAIWILVYTPISGLLNTLLLAFGLDALALDWLGNPRLALGALFVAWLWSSLGIGMAIFRVGMDSIGREYIEIATIEGAGPLWIFRHVTLPGLRRAIIAVVLVNTALGSAVFDLVFVTTHGGPGYATMIVPLEVYGFAFGAHTGEGAAAACLQILLGLVLIALALLFLRGGESLDTGERRESSTTSVPATGAMVLVAAFLLLPLGWLMMASIQPGRAFALGLTAPGPDPRTWAWSNFSSVWDAGMSGALETSFLLALGAVIGTLLLALPASFALVHLVRRRLMVYGILILLVVGLLQPTQVVVIPLFSLLGDLKLPPLWGVLLPEIARTIPFAVLVLWAFMASSPRDVVQAAAVDGASPRQQLVHIVMPLVQPATVAVSIWAFVTSWNEYLLPTIAARDGSLQTVPTLLATFIGTYNTQFGQLAAGSLMAMAPSLVLYLALRRPAVAGLSGVRWGGRNR